MNELTNHDLKNIEGYCALAAAIVRQVCKDYIAVEKKLLHGDADGDSGSLIRAVCCYARATHKDIFALMLDVAKHFENGALKYGEHNWQKGIPVSRYVDSALRHLMKDLAGETDEDHAAAFVWNCMCAAWTMKHLPKMDDYTQKCD